MQEKDFNGSILCFLWIGAVRIDERIRGHEVKQSDSCSPIRGKRDCQERAFHGAVEAG